MERITHPCSEICNYQYQYRTGFLGLLVRASIGGQRAQAVIVKVRLPSRIVSERLFPKISGVLCLEQSRSLNVLVLWSSIRRVRSRLLFETVLLSYARWFLLLESWVLALVYQPSLIVLVPRSVLVQVLSRLLF